MAFFANQALDVAKNQLINFAKDYLISQLQDKLNQGDAGIKALFVELKEKLKNYTVLNKNVLQTILVPICKLKQEESVKTDLNTRIDKIDFSTELEKMPGITYNMKLKIDALPETLKTELKTLIDELITCDNVSANGNPAVATGGSKQQDRKQNRRQKTKKRIYKKSRGRRQYSRK